MGIGTAHLYGINWAYDRRYSVLMSFDCDFTHPPEYLPVFLEMGHTCDLVIGSRYLGQNGLSEWNAYRTALTRIGHFLTTHMLGMPYDATTSFRLYQLDRIPRSIFQRVVSTGYSFFFESTYLMYLHGVRIRETPVVLPARAQGSSKMGLIEIAKSIANLVRLFALARSTRNCLQPECYDQKSAGCLRQ
jgi:dolichol-phosphate mannosyltransferase